MIKRLKHYLRFLRGLIGTNLRLLYGMWKLTELPQPAITIFGGARIKKDHPYAKKASQLSKQLVADGFSIVTGGGPGIMEAANFGALEYLKECRLNENGTKCTPIVSAGIGLVRLNLDKQNPYVQKQIIMRHFFARKWLLVRYSIGFIVFPGGFGTLDEFFEIITLRQTSRMQEAPIILIDSEYWSPIVDWMYNRALRDGLISKEDLNLISILDDVDKVANIICEYRRSLKRYKSNVQ
jgi:uncharacterized protein (TIGR00730 family)